MKIALTVSLILLATACGHSQFKGTVPTAQSTKTGDAAPEAPEPSEDAKPAPAVPDQPEVVKEPLPAADTEVTSPLVLHCGDADAQSKIVTAQVQKIVFPAKSPGCEWAVTPKDAHLTGFARSKQVIQLPKGEICEIGMDSPKKSMMYDGMLILDLDKIALFISSTDLAKSVDQVEGVYHWDSLSEKILGKWFNFDTDDFYCLNDNKAECTIPKTQQMGPITINIPSAKVAPIARNLIGKDSAELTLTVTGDDDAAVDCQHSELELNVNIRYLPN